jgi:hypothetical protein
MQSCRAGSGATHGSDFLPRFNFLLFPDQHCIVMSVGTQVIIVVFDDNKITVTAQRVTGIDDAPICGRDNSLSLTACNIDTFIAAFRATKVLDNLAISRPAPCEIGELVDVLLAVGWVVLTVGCRHRRDNRCGRGRWFIIRQHLVSTLFT